MELTRPIVFGNWKMHGLRAEARDLASALASLAAGGQGAAGTLGVFPPATVLAEVVSLLDGTGVVVGAQDCHEREKGAFTGSLSAHMLRDAGAAAVIVGHSERRQLLGEADALVRAKAEAALAAGLLAVVCVGETEAEYLAGRTLERLAEQLEGSLPRDAPPGRLVVAYEPVWAIGTGRTPSSADIARTHASVAGQLAALAGEGGSVPLLYGGSVKAENAREILAIPGVDGVLVGGASLDAAGFWSILKAGGAA